jgi:lysophospholipid acyltransferase (LPLAT)-like uncharacterized protein
MKLGWPPLYRAAGMLGSTLLNAWMGSLDVRAVYYNEVVDPASPSFRGPVLYVMWHEYICVPVYLRAHCGITMLLSQHADADLLRHIAQPLGFDFVRGSTKRGALAALRKLLTDGRDRNLVITPDGPRGPRRTLAAGPVYLASRLQVPLVAMGFGCDRPWRVKSWDRFAIPRYGSRVRCVLGPSVRLPLDLDRDGVEHYRQRTEALLNRLTLEAEAWAEAGTRKLGEQVVLRCRAQNRRRLTAPLYLKSPGDATEFVSPSTARAA